MDNHVGYMRLQLGSAVFEFIYSPRDEFNELDVLHDLKACWDIWYGSRLRVAERKAAAPEADAPVTDSGHTGESDE